MLLCPFLKEVPRGSYTFQRHLHTLYAQLYRTLQCQRKRGRKLVSIIEEVKVWHIYMMVSFDGVKDKKLTTNYTYSYQNTTSLQVCQRSQFILQISFLSDMYTDRTKYTQEKKQMCAILLHSHARSKSNPSWQLKHFAVSGGLLYINACPLSNTSTFDRSTWGLSGLSTAKFWDEELRRPESTRCWIST